MLLLIHVQYDGRELLRNSMLVYNSNIECAENAQIRKEG